jgi:energy-coupling factor transporter ATP-binding protein EcfA2
MELVYLWIEKYKNIENQGFNFSPRFECEFKDGVLTIDEKEDYVSIFPENINVTAIVGENGSGKTTLFEIIAKLFVKEKFDNEVIFIINLKGNLLCNKKDLGLQLFDTTFFLFLKSVYYSPNFTNSGLNNFIENFATPFVFRHKKESFHQNHSLFPHDNIKNQSLLNLYINAPRFIERHPTISHYRQKDAFTIEEYNSHINLAKSIIILSFMEHFGKEFLNIDNQNNYVKISIHENKITNGQPEINFIKRLEKLLEIKQEFLSNEEKEEYFKLFNKNEEEYKKRLTDFINFSKQKIDNNLESYQTLSLNINDTSILVNNYLELYWLNRNLDFNILNFQYENLSSGEENLFLMFALISDGIIPHTLNNSSPSYITILLDEIENNIHPNKQKELLSKIITYLNIITYNTMKEYNKKLNFNIIVASHSSFILSDIPKENVIFLGKDKENGLCKNLSKDIKLKTFGANIHTLLSDGFFMSDGLMGEFAKSKITEIKDFYNENKDLKNEDSNFESKKDEFKKNKKYFENIQKIIGEPFLQTIIKNYLDELEILFNGKKEFLNKEIKRLEELRNEIK